MKIKNFYFTLLAVSLLCACSESEPPVENPPEQMMELTYPLVGDEVHYCCFSFEWDDPNNENEYRIQIAKYSSFNDLLLDTVVLGTSFEFPSFLTPRNTYNWRVTGVDSEISQKSEFQIIDYADHLSGSYDATIKKYAWNGLQGATTDTTFQTILKIWKGDDHSISYESENSNGKVNVPFSELLGQDYVLYRIDHDYPRNIDFIRYYFNTDSIVTYSESGGNGGYGYTQISALINK
ncbi:MAG: hypothetical protein P1U56_04920 [Saprospiraceae bacterium]|nr:hypothetical protein [Saprospiraceae bacterium]